MEQFIPTGNEFISLPKINRATAGIEDITFLYMAFKGLLELRGSQDCPLVQPFFSCGIDTDTAVSTLQNPVWSRLSGWIPQLDAVCTGLQVHMVILPPVKERGFILRLSVTAGHAGSYTWGLRGCWASTWHCINEDKQLEGSMHCYKSGWNSGIAFDFRACSPVFAFAPMTDLPCEAQYEQANDGIRYSLSRAEHFAAGETKTVTFFWGFGFEEVAAVTSAKEMLRRGFEWELAKTQLWLESRRQKMKTASLSNLYNTNLFFCIFYSTGMTLDTEEFVCVTSRSPRYYVSAAYWDRDTLLWAFPAILEVDAALAKQILLYVFTRQQRNIGLHSRYIDGTLLEPGFELDELVAPVLALHAYLLKTKDTALQNMPAVQSGITHILQMLQEVYSPSLGLYETFLQPTDDEIRYPFLTYDNVLVWKAYTCLAELFPRERSGYLEKANATKAAIHRHCTRKNDRGELFYVWSVDLQSHFDIYDEPPGSLQLLAYYGFCDANDPICQRTIQMIRLPSYEYSFANSPIAEIGCPHAPHPWILSLCNSLLCGYASQAWVELERLEMDAGIACESVDENTGVCTTGAAFATCAGFLCHSMKQASEEVKACGTI